MENMIQILWDLGFQIIEIGQVIYNWLFVDTFELLGYTLTGWQLLISLTLGIFITASIVKAVVPFL